MNPYLPLQNDLSNPQDQLAFNPSDNKGSNSNTGAYPNLPLPNPQQYSSPNYPFYPNLNQNAYFPPNQYGNPQANRQISSEERAYLEFQITELEDQLKNGSFCAYRFWLWFAIVLAFGFFGGLYYFGDLIFGLTGHTSAIFFFILFVPSGIWAIYFSWVMLRAMSSNDLTSARKGLSL